MRFSLSFSMDNDAFQGGRATGEVVRVLGELVHTISQSGVYVDSDAGMYIRDVNGNGIGTWEVTQYH